MRLLLFVGFSLLLFLSSCVSSRKFEDLQKESQSAREQYNSCKEDLDATKKYNQDLLGQVKTMQRDNEELRRDSMMAHGRFSRTKAAYEELNAVYEKLLSNNQALASNASVELRRALEEKSALKIETMQQKQEISTLQNQLASVRRQAQDTEVSSEALKKDLIERQKRMAELETNLRQQKSQLDALKSTLKTALGNFKDDELTVEEKNGKIYVSLSQELLFDSGSSSLDTKGKGALKSISGALKKNEDFEITIEGHTDDIPVKSGKKYSDNWDLSVLRSTSIVRELINNGVSPRRIAASGRGQFYPVDTNTTPDGRALNRRTEIILTPRLDKLYQIINK